MSHLSLSKLWIACHHTILHGLLLHSIMSLLHRRKLCSILGIVHAIWHLLTRCHHLYLSHLRCRSHHARMRAGLTHALSRSPLSHHRCSLPHCRSVVRYLRCAIPAWPLIAWPLIAWPMIAWPSSHSYPWVTVLHCGTRTSWAARHALLRALCSHRYCLWLTIIDDRGRVAVRCALSHDRRGHRLSLSDLVVHVRRNSTKLRHLLGICLSLLRLLSLHLLLHLKLLLLLLSRGRGLHSILALFHSLDLSSALSLLGLLSGLLLL
jgi:hypothetical protein